MLSSILLPVAVSSAFTAAGQPGITVEYETDRVVTMREPIIVTVTMTNHLDRPVVLELGWNLQGAFALTLKGPGGPAKTVTPHNPNPLGGLSLGTEVRLAPGERHSQRLLLNQWFSFRRPGEYRLSVAFGGHVNGPGATILGDGGVTIRILPRDERALRRRCEALLAEVGAYKQEAAEALASIDDPVVAGYLGRAMTLNHTADDVAIDALDHEVPTRRYAYSQSPRPALAVSGQTGPKRH